MGLPLGDIKLSANFELNIAKPLDSRLVVSDITERNNISFKYAGMVVWVVSNSAHYKLLNDLVTWETNNGNISVINDLDDVIISSPFNNQSLVYDTASTSWINKSIGILNNHSSNKVLNPYVTNGNFSTSGLSISNTPLGDILITVNGLIVDVSFGTVSGSCYFADPSNISVARNYLEIVANDVLIWNGTNVGYELETSDEISFYYES